MCAPVRASSLIGVDALVQAPLASVRLIGCNHVADAAVVSLARRGLDGATLLVHHDDTDTPWQKFQYEISFDVEHADFKIWKQLVHKL